MMSKKIFFFTVNDQKRDIDESTVVWTPIDNGKLANQIARLLAIVVKKCAWLDVQRALHTPNPPTAPFCFMKKAERLGSSVTSVTVMAAFVCSASQIHCR